MKTKREKKTDKKIIKLQDYNRGLLHLFKRKRNGHIISGKAYY